MTYLRPCPACDTQMPHVELWRKNECAVVRCDACGLGAALATAFNPGSYYTADYFSGALADGYADYAGSESVLRAEFARVVDRLRALVPDGGTLVELGSAYGFFLMEAEQHFRVHGFEMADAAAASARARGLDVRTGPATEEQLAALGPLDAVVMLDVIEHLDDPAATLRLCAAHLKPGGVMLVTTGDFASLVARLTGRRWRLMTPPQHLWFFTPRSLANMAGRVGLDVIDVAHPGKTVPLSLMLYQIARMIGFKPTAHRFDALSKLGVPVNLFDAMRVTLRRRKDESR